MAAAGTVAQIPVDFGHGRSREAGQMKEDDEGIPFQTLLTAERHRGDRILRRFYAYGLQGMRAGL
jgi:hypothetical protein